MMILLQLKTTNIKIIAFGIAAEKMKTNSVTAESISNVDDLKLWLNDCYPVLKNLNISISVNKIIIHENISLNDGDEVALLPPFSGG